MNFSGTLRINKFACFTLVFILLLIVYWRSGGSNYPVDRTDFVNLKSLLKAAIYAAENGGKKIIESKDHKLTVKSKGKTREGLNDPITEVDYASHCVMYYGLKKTFPKVAVVSEEHKTAGDEACELQEVLDVDEAPPGHSIIEYLNDEHIFTKDVTIWIDPLDATVEYTEGLYQYVTTMVCIAVSGNPVIGVIHYPFPPRTYWGWVTKKTSSNIPSVVHKPENKDQPKVVVSRSHPGKVAELAKKAFGASTNVTTGAGAGNKVMGVVNGTFDVYFHATVIKKWDLCAGDAIIRAANGQMTTAKGDLIKYHKYGDVRVTDGLLVSLFDHEYYLSKMSKIMSDLL